MKTVGIDLGTTNSAVAVMEGGQPKVIPSSEGGNTIPSVVDVKENVVGEVAKRQLVVAPQKTIYSVKRLMGQRFKSDAVQEALKHLSYEVVSGKDDMAVVKVGDKTYTPQEVSAKILQKIKKDAEGYLGEDVTAAVITVPAYFDDSQRAATKQAGEIAGLEVKRIINEPTAAALAYGLEKQENEVIAVYDLGGGTFDISILEVGDGVFEVKSTSGDTHLGGDDFDKKIIDHIVGAFKNEQGVDLYSDKQALQRIKDAAEKAKIELSTKQETEINIPYITADDRGPKHLQQTLTRAKLENLVDGLIDKTFESVKQALDDAEVEPDQIHEVILVGGQTRMPAVQKHVEEFFGKGPHKGVNPDEVVAIGAAIQAGVLGGEVKDVLLLDVTPLTLGIETLGGVMTPLIERNTTIPTSESQIFSTAASNQTSVEVHVLQGERPMAADNKSLGKFILSGIPPSPRGVPQIEVTFDIDANGILNVSAKDKGTGKEQKITIKDSTGLEKDEIEKMKQEAQAHAEEDEKKKKLIELRNRADTLIYTTEQTLEEAGEKVDENVKSQISNLKQELQETLESENSDEIEGKMNALSEKLQEVGAKIYEQAAQSAGSDPQTAGSSEESGVQEGEVVDEEENDG